MSNSETIEKIRELFNNEQFCNGDEFICKLMERVNRNGNSTQFSEDEISRVMLYHEEMSSGVWLDFIYGRA